MPSLAAAFNAITTRAATVTRKGGSYVDGYWIEGATQSFQIRASIQPIKSDNQNEWMRLPEGIRDEAEAVIYTTFAIRGGDEVEQGSERYRVLSLDKWGRLGGYTKAILGGMKS